MLVTTKVPIQKKHNLPRKSFYKNEKEEPSAQHEIPSTKSFYHGIP
jgi:hypothetical protein